MAVVTAPRTPRKPRPKPARSIRLTQLPAAGHSGVVKITVGKKTAGYYLDLLPADFGRAFRLVKFLSEQTPVEPSHYDVLLDGQRSSCECKGFCRHGHCKHVDALAAVKDRLPSLASASRHAPELVAPACAICGEPMDGAEGHWHEACGEGDGPGRLARRLEQRHGGKGHARPCPFFIPPFAPRGVLTVATVLLCVAAFWLLGCLGNSVERWRLSRM